MIFINTIQQYHPDPVEILKKNSNTATQHVTIHTNFQREANKFLKKKSNKDLPSECMN